jgi:ABC-2 type transport system permease protein
LRRLISQAKIETKVFLRYKESVFWNFAFPIFFMVLFGFLGFGGGDGVRYVDFLLPGIIAMAVMTTCIISTAIDIVSDRDKGIFRRLFVTPLPRSVFLGGKILHRYVIVLLQTGLLILVAAVFFGVRMDGNYLVFWLLLTVGMFSFLSIGFLISSFLRKTESAQPVSMITFFVLMFLGETFWPAQAMPGFVKAVSKVLPSTYLNHALRAVSIEGAGLGVLKLDVLVLTLWMVGCFVLSARFFRWE